MITRIEIDGFKSLRDFAVDLEPLTVFIGPNNAGKSNILEAIALLSRLCTQPVDEAFKQGRGRAIAQFARSGGEPGRTIRIAVELLLPPAFDHEGVAIPNRYRYELTIERRSRPSGASEYLGVMHEGLWVLDRASDTWIASHADLAGYVHHAAEKYCILERVGEDAQQALSATTGGMPDLAAGVLSAFRLLHLAPAALRASSERIGPDTLAPDGSNLPAVLANLPASLVGEIRADLVSVVPGLASFDVVPDGDELRIEFTLAGGERVPAELTSDGTLRILALLTALRVQPRPSAIGVDELENGIYPGRLRRLLELLQESVALDREDDAGEDRAESAERLPVQLLLTTHSPVMLDAFRSRLECLRFVDLVRRDRRIVTRARPVRPQAGDDRGRLTVSLREVDQLLQSAESEIASGT